ncbi:MAG: hypothetical protein HOW73_01335 [Polyangiaceae bacterium]|nr:hypothetical protein [Polyangiaceae bacterium]
MATFSLSCGDDGYAWEKSGKAPALEVLPAASSSADVLASAAAEETPTPHGGLWTRCLEGLQAETDPVRDVTRLVAVCGPVTGMDPVGDGIIEGAIAEGAPVTLELPMAKGRCYRVFAAADRGVSELDVEVRTSRGTIVASDHTTGRIAVAQPDRPFCTGADDTAAITVRSGPGSGAFALEVLSVASTASH